MNGDGREAIERALQDEMLRLGEFLREPKTSEADRAWAVCALEALTRGLSADDTTPGPVLLLPNNGRDDYQRGREDERREIEAEMEAASQRLLTRLSDGDVATLERIVTKCGRS